MIILLRKINLAITSQKSLEKSLNMPCVKRCAKVEKTSVLPHKETLNVNLKATLSPNSGKWNAPYR